ncbi:MAG: peptidoglycan-binding protein [Patescibacteria group bacterium]
MSKKYLILGLLVVSFVAVPLFSNAQSAVESAVDAIQVNRIAEINRLIASFRQQIADLQRQLAELQRPQPGGWCHAFYRNLQVGLGRDNDVHYLRRALTQEGLDNLVSDGDFDARTETAVKKFQAKHGISNTGFVGPLTRAKLNQLYKCNRPLSAPLPTNFPPVISGVSGPTTLNVGQTETWTVQASDPENGQLAYSVIWGDEPMMASGAMMTPQAESVRQTASFTHAYATAGTYTPAFTVTDNSGQSARSSLSVVVGQDQNSPITVTSPNGGEQWVAGSVQPVTWRYARANSRTKVDLYLQREWSCASGFACPAVMSEPIVLDRNISARTTYNWIVGTDIADNPIPSGDYRIIICPAGQGSPWSSRNSNCDASDNYFAILGPTN